MDERTITCIQKLKEEDGVSNGGTNISDLPEAILVHILSFLPTRDAARTSTLSKEWQHLWTAIPNLIFYGHWWGYSNDKCPHFMDSIDKVLLRHAPSSIKVFCLTFEDLHREDRLRFDGWVSNVVRHNVEECTLHLFSVQESETFQLHYSLFMCDTLVKLDLRFRTTTTLNLPAQVYLPNLKVFSLENVKIVGKCSIQQLFSSPTLERLFLKQCDLVYVRAVNICAPKLKHLTIIESRGPMFGLDDPCHVTICNCYLEHLRMRGRIFHEYSTSNLSAVHVNLYISNDAMSQAAHHLNRVLHGMSAVQKLDLHSTTLHLFEHRPELMSEWSNWPAFTALNTLQLSSLKIVKSEVFRKILQSTPHLRTLRLNKCMFRYNEEDEEIFDPVPSCFSSSLKKITIVPFWYLEERQLYVFKAMLKYAMVLEELVISSEAKPMKDDLKWSSFCHKLLSYPRGSKNCKIVL